ncbi:hypothetical protein L7H23_17750 [Sphingopyxis sp. BSN-002]|uniref:hypothetical protein n=1 Tax=Sphingopyxis sp. BSN-002 TaxID=2911495 RepID=UPI001EDC1C52|nr:hypothetical protein [Sphingopyxis sp. BSN-002]UKK84391.1 hypothetical protein L7H23_17750 [Sphingopyxis sp. BSN-002]
MRASSIITVVTALFVSIGVTLASSLTAGSGTNNLNDFDTIYYVRNVEHGQLSVFGDCPLGREIAIERTGKVRISWYAQQPEHHGCMRAIDLAGSDDDEKQWEEPVIARAEIMLGKADLRLLLDRLNRLRWETDWQEPKNMSLSFTTDCEQRTNSFSDRVLAVAKPGPEVANLWVYGEEVRSFGDAKCTANETANAAILDASVAPFVSLLPARYHLRPAVAERLYRNP